MIAAAITLTIIGILGIVSGVFIAFRLENEKINPKDSPND